jgi:hypothetical protein
VQGEGCKKNVLIHRNKKHFHLHFIDNLLFNGIFKGLLGAPLGVHILLTSTPQGGGGLRHISFGLSSYNYILLRTNCYPLLITPHRNAFLSPV